MTIEQTKAAIGATSAGSASGYKSVTLLASEHSNLAEYLGQLERERDKNIALLRYIEEESLRCPVCGSGGMHRRGCRLAKALK